MALAQSLKGVLFLLTLLLTIVIGDVMLLFPLVPFIWIAPRLRRAIIDRIAWAWCTITAFFFEFVFKVQFYINGDALPKNHEPAILLSNHPSRLDWMFLWVFTRRIGTLAREKIFLKSEYAFSPFATDYCSLKYVPFAGWAMQAFCFIFLRRKWEDDEPYITRAITHLFGYGYPYQYLLFAEGTDLSPSNLEKDTKFAEERRVTVYRHLLHPRTRGFEHLVELMRPFPNACVYDLTVAYEGVNGYLTEKRLLTGDLPTAAHVDLRRIPLSSLPTGNAAVGEWLKSHWDAKEKQLAAFYTCQPRAFPDRSNGGPLLRSQLRETATMYTITSFGVMIMWLTILATFFYLFFSSHWFKLYAVVAWVSLAYFSRTGGLDALEQRVVKHT